MSKFALFVLLSTTKTVNSFTTSNHVAPPTQKNFNALNMDHNDNNNIKDEITRSSFFELVKKTAFVSSVVGFNQQPAFAESRPETLDIDNFLRTGKEK